MISQEMSEDLKHVQRLNPRVLQSQKQKIQYMVALE